MNKPVQIIVTPGGERLVVLSEADYEKLLAASDDDEGEVRPELEQELLRRRHDIAQGKLTERR